MTIWRRARPPATPHDTGLRRIWSRSRGFGRFTSDKIERKDLKDLPSDTLLFHSTCDPLGGNPYGVQLFAMRLDGTGLRQLTDTHGYQFDRASGSVSFEAPFPWAHPEQKDG